MAKKIEDILLVILLSVMVIVTLIAIIMVRIVRPSLSRRMAKRIKDSLFWVEPPEEDDD